jgi:hypothetical protein
VTPALAIGAALMLVALNLLRASQPDGQRTAEATLAVRRARLRQVGLATALLALGLTAALGGTRDIVLLLAASGIGGWLLAITSRRTQTTRWGQPRRRFPG